MIRQKILEHLQKVVKDLGYSADDIVLSIPKNSQFGDYSTNLALQLAKLKLIDDKQSPQVIASKILEKFGKPEYLEKAEIAGGGFINFFIKKEFLANDIKEILARKGDFGRSQIGKEKKARVEFVSANPTGPLHFGNARGGPIGDVLANVLEFVGYKVLREYIDNDRGNQVNDLGNTLAARAGIIKADEESLTYKGEYTKELAAEVIAQIGDTTKLSETEIISKAGEIGVKLLFKEIIKDCEDIGMKFDFIVHESELQKKAPAVLDELEKRGLLKKYEDATWFAPRNEFLEDKDAVVVKSDGNYTYFTADVVYHREKFTSGYDLVVDVFGSNTAGHVPKLQALASVFNFDPSKFKIILYQFVRIKRGSEVVKMSKRAGNFVTVREVLDEVGLDAFRFYLLRFAPQTHMDFDLELVKEQSNKNPVFYVQYAHARMNNILVKAKEDEGDTNLSLLIHLTEINLIKHLSTFPDLVEEIASNFQVHQFTEYAMNLADLFHKFYESCPVLQAEDDLKEARLALVNAAKITLGNTLGLLGVSAPERM